MMCCNHDFLCFFLKTTARNQQNPLHERSVPDRFRSPIHVKTQNKTKHNYCIIAFRFKAETAITSMLVDKITDNIGAAVIHLCFSLFGSDGTTDVTRTMHFGTPSAFEKVYMLWFYYQGRSQIKAESIRPVKTCESKLRIGVWWL